MHGITSRIGGESCRIYEVMTMRGPEKRVCILGGAILAISIDVSMVLAVHSANSDSFSYHSNYVHTYIRNLDY